MGKQDLEQVILANLVVIKKSPASVLLKGQSQEIFHLNFSS
jgi:hypothetical protein